MDRWDYSVRWVFISGWFLSKEFVVIQASVVQD